jgi:hypothetical protein
MIFIENVETGQFLFLIVLILSWFTCSWRHPFLSYDVISNFVIFDRPSYYLNDKWKKSLAYIIIFLRKRQILIQKFHLIFNVKILINLKLKLTIKCNANVEIVPRQPVGTHRHFVHFAQ